MPPVLQKTIREIHQRLRALETREYAEVVGPGSVINAQYLTLALHAVLTAERRFVAGDGLVGTDAGANADYTLDVDLVAAWSGLEFVGGELRVDEDADFTWTGTHTFNANILMGGGITIDGMDPSAFLVTYAAHDHSAGDPTQVDHADLVNILANQHHAEVHIVNSTGPHAEAGLAVGNVLRASGAAAFAFAQLQHGDLGGIGVNDHHAEVHVVNSTGPHAEAGLTIGHVLRASAAAAFSFAALQAGDIPGLGGVPALTFGLVNAAGAAATYIQTDASIAIFDAVVPGTIQCDDAANTGAAAFAARRDHQHAIICAIAVDIANANAEGVLTYFSRSDHIHNHPAALGANLHHTQIHDVVGGDHTLTGAQWNLVGATALNTIGLLLPSSNPGAVAAILMSDGAGDLTLHDLTATGQLSAGAGIAEGLILGADAQWYRSAANMLRTPDSVTIDIGLNVGTATGAGVSLPVDARSDRDGHARIRIQNDTAGVAAQAGFLIEVNSALGGLFLYDDGYADAIFADNLALLAAATAANLLLMSEAGEVRIYTGGIAAGNLAMTVDSSQNVGIGMAPGGSRRLDLMTDVNDYAVGFRNDGDNANRKGMFITAGTDAGGGGAIAILFEDGNFGACGYIHIENNQVTLDNPSDKTLKQHIVDTASVMARLRQVKVRDFTMKRSGGRLRGFIAQELGGPFPEMVGFDEDHKLYYTQPMKMIPVNTKAIQELDVLLGSYRLNADAEREALREQIGIMQNRLAVLEQAA